ncbi:MAG: DUF1553 domain-containing protein [Cyclobacteriaceae bacterium]
MVYIFGTLVLALGLSCSSDKPDAVVKEEANLPEVIDFNFHVKPILSDKCYACHGPDMSNQKADLRLDTPEGAYALLGEDQDHSAIVPGKLNKSHAYLRMVSDDPEFAMPPPEFKVELTNKEIATIAKWIEQGAEYKPHWSFIPPEDGALPDVQDETNIEQPLDRFILARLEQEGMSLSDRASKETLIRRASFDLTGLPPTLEEINSFLEDDSADAYEKVIDRLLASKAYGERMAADWMDVSRFADSDGYLDDKHRDFSPWRDWVIKAFNENMPYDQFVTWQLAGDLIPNATQESILATAFNRLNKKTSEAGIVFEEYRVEYTADRTHTLGTAFMGLTLECARCHDHKYDPISQKDYYKLFGFFNSTDEMGTPVYGPDQTPGPALLLSSEEEQEQIKFLRNLITEREAKDEQVVSDKEKYQRWAANHKITSSVIQKSLKESLVAYYPFDKFTKKSGDKVSSPNVLSSSKPADLNRAIIKEGKFGQAVYIDDYNGGKLGDKVGWYERTDPFSIQLYIKPDTVHKEAAIIYHAEELRLGNKGYFMTLRDNRVEFVISHSWPQNAIQVITKEAVEPKEWSQITVTYDGSSKASGITIYVNGDAKEFDVDYDNLYKGILYEYNIHTYGFQGIAFGARSKYVPFKGGGLDEIKVYNKDLTSLEVLHSFNSNLAYEKMNAGDIPPSAREEYYFARIDTERKETRSQLKETRDKENDLFNGIQEIMVMGDLAEPRPTYVLNRGVYSARGEQVEPGVPESVMEFDENLPKNRLGLTKWLFDSKNPLTARVFVNRIWQMHFGRGLVNTTEDFGSQGSLPSHPKLLDWLALQFQNSDWDIKGLHKLILTSGTYMQRSVVNDELLEKDPENVLLARGPKFRLPAEMIRDNALAISGLLVDDIGGESVYPYQPAGIWDGLTTKSWAYRYLQEPGDGLYRRSLYTIWKRSAPPPSMLIFDIADRGVCTVKRELSNTPLQALVLLNDPQFVEASRVLAEKLIKTNKDTTERLETAFRLVTGRKPDQFESEQLCQFFDAEFNNFETNKVDALALLNTGESSWDASLNPAEVAALGVVVNSLMNTDAGYSKN